MSSPRLPVRPCIEDLVREAVDLQNATLHSDHQSLQQAQESIASRYQVSSWSRLVHACEWVDAIWQDDEPRIQALLLETPHLLHENARGIADCNWGPPMSYAANLGRTKLVRLLAEAGAQDFDHALGRSLLQGKIETATWLHEAMGKPRLSHQALEGPAYTLDVEGTAFALQAGASVSDAEGHCLAPVQIVLETDSRIPRAKHAILELYAANGLVLPDTPVMALHRGRLDLLEQHILRDPSILRRPFRHEEIYPADLGCHDDVLATHGTPLRGATLLHLCIDYDEWDIACWLLDHGADPNARAVVDADGFGGHSPLFCAVVSQPNFWHNRRDSNAATSNNFVDLLLKHGADSTVRASLKKQLHPGYAPDFDTSLHVYRNVTAKEWGEQFHAQAFVDQQAVQRLKELDPGITLRRVSPLLPAVSHMFQELDSTLLSMVEVDQAHFVPAKQLLGEASVTLGAWEGDMLVGMGSIQFHDQHAQILRMFTSPSARGKGIAKRILRELEACAQHYRSPRIRLETNADFSAAVALYQKSGYNLVPNEGAHEPHSASQPHRCGTRTMIFEKQFPEFSIRSMPNLKRSKLDATLVRLRPSRTDDLPHFFSMQSDTIANCEAVVYPRSREAFEQHWRKILISSGVEARTILYCEEIAGYVSSFAIDGTLWIGYWLDRPYWGFGIASEAVAQLLASNSKRPIHARVAVRNLASKEVLLKNGFKVVKTQWADANESYPACEEFLLMLERIEK